MNTEQQCVHHQIQIDQVQNLLECRDTCCIVQMIWGASPSGTITCCQNEMAHQPAPQHPAEFSSTSRSCRSIRHREPPHSQLKALAALSLTTFDTSMSYNKATRIQERSPGTVLLNVKSILFIKQNSSTGARAASQKRVEQKVDVLWKSPSGTKQHYIVECKAHLVTMEFSVISSNCLGGDTCFRGELY